VRRGKRCFALLLGGLALPLATAGDVFRDTGEHGEVSFSDVATPGAERVAVDTTPPVADAQAESARRIDQTLTVANDLERSRLAREAARERSRIEAVQRAQARQAADRAQQTDPEPTYRYPLYLDRYPRWRPPHVRPPHPRPGRQRPYPDRSQPERTSPFPALQIDY
jgi:hypothetical protein